MREKGQAYWFSFLDKSFKQKRIKVEMTGSNKPNTNHIFGFRPIRLAMREVMRGMLNKNIIPILTNNAAPMLILYYLFFLNVYSENCRSILNRNQILYPYWSEQIK